MCHRGMDTHRDMTACLRETAALGDDRPMGLDGRFYTDPAWFDFEKDGVLRAGWHCACRADEVAAAGDYLTLTLLGEPLLIVRGDDGTVRALANLCRHRGMPLAEGEGSAKRFVCSYHAWSYGRDGRLLRAGRMRNAGFDPATCALPGWPVREWGGFVYVSLGDGATVPELGALEAEIGAYEPQAYRIEHAAQETWRCNWKCLVENFMEGYHLSVVHPRTLRGYTPTELSQKGPSGAGFTSYRARYPEGIPSRGRGAPGLDDAARNRSTLFAVFPCQVASVAASLLVSLSLRPVAVDRVDVRWTLSVHGDDLDAGTVAQRVALWNEVNREDREKLERLQAVLGSRHAAAGPLAEDDYEGTIRDFHRWLARCVARP